MQCFEGRESIHHDSASNDSNDKLNSSFPILIQPSTVPFCNAVGCCWMLCHRMFYLGTCGTHGRTLKFPHQRYHQLPEGSLSWNPGDGMRRKDGTTKQALPKWSRFTKVPKRRSKAYLALRKASVRKPGISSFLTSKS